MTVTVPSTIRDTEGLDGVSITQTGDDYATTITGALNTSTDLAQAGAVFNDAVRLSEGGLWTGSTSLEMASADNQQPYEPMYVQDINAVQADVNAMLANPTAITVGGQAISDPALVSELQTMQGQLATLLHEAPLSVGTSADAATAQGTIALTQQQILSEVNGDPTLASALNAAAYQSGTGFTNVGFQALPTGSDSATALAAAEGSSAAPPTLAQIGAVFNAANDLSAGGLNANNLTEFNSDMQAVATGLTNLINNPTALAAIEANEQAGVSDQGQPLTVQQEQALTTLHLDTVLDQVEMQINKFDPMYATNPNDAARSTNDNMLDIVDIVNNDPALAAAAGDVSTANNGAQPNQTFTATGTGGFGEFPSYLNGVGGVNDHGGTILQYQDNQAQTNFWSQFVAEANQLNNTLNGIASGAVQPTSSEIQSLITQVNNYSAFGASFDGAQGGVFGDRFDNELLSGTLKADTANAVAGLQSIEANGLNATNAAQIVAAGVGFVADANDVSGNNLPTGGGSYVGNATTVAGATTTGAATPGTTVPAGAVDGNDNPTTNPVDANTNNGFGVSNPDPNGGTTTTTTASGTDTGTGSGTDTGSGTSGTTTGGSSTTLSANVANDLAHLIQALQGGNQGAINTALASLESDVNGNSGSGSTAGNGSGNGSNGGHSGGNTAGSTGNSGGHGEGPGAGDFGHHHFEMIWHHA
jgi:hypothetical protein